MERLKLVALDEADLAVVSACLQDAVFKVADLAFKGQGHIFTLEANRFVWEADGKKKSFERRRAVLAVKRVSAVRSRGIDRGNGEEVHSLLALRFAAEAEGPQGTIELVLAGGGSVLLDVECIEVQLSDVSGSWGTEFKPRHQLG
jgi:Protein of unknown function (DUF2948).